MFKILMLNFGSLLFVVLLCMVYFSKKRFLSIRNKLFRYMLVDAIVLLVTEIITSFCAYYINSDFLTLLFSRIAWFNGIIWFSLLYYYSIVFVENIEADNIKNIMFYNVKNKAMTIIFIIFSVIYLFIPFDLIRKGNITYLPGQAAYFVLIFCAFCVLSIVIYIINNSKNIPIRKKVSVWSMIMVITITYILQFVYQEISVMGMGVTLQMFLLYFIIENPDLEIISDLEKLKDQIEKSSKAKSDFLSNMSHEIRTPMNAIVGLSAGLINEPNFDSESARADIKHISAAGNNLLEIINNILDISKIESGKENLELKEYSIGNITMELSSIIDARLADKPIKLMIDIDNSIPSKLYGDSTKIFQILLNLLTNAAKYTEVGKIKLNITSEYVDEENVMLHIKVSDTGFGIKKEDFDKLFVKFSRLESATENEIEGTGLGLVITKKFVDLMGGKIWFESEFEVGTTFYVDIKQKVIDKRIIGKINEPQKIDIKQSYLDCSGRKVLIVDDNKLNIKVATRILESYKFTIDSVTNGKDCIYKIKSGEKFDMIFLDHMMPEMDGIQVLKILKKLEDYELPTIVALTANAITGMKEVYLNEGFDEYLSKPINVVELNKIINKYFNKEGINNEKNI